MADVNVSGIKTDEEYAETIEPWFLAAVYRRSGADRNKSVLKIDAFVVTPLQGFKGDQKEMEKYDGLKGSMVYWQMMELVVERLVRKGYLVRTTHPAYVQITDAGIAKCHEPTGEGSWNIQYYRPDDKKPAA